MNRLSGEKQIEHRVGDIADVGPERQGLPVDHPLIACAGHGWPGARKVRNDERPARVIPRQLGHGPDRLRGRQPDQARAGLTHNGDVSEDVSTNVDGGELGPQKRGLMLPKMWLTSVVAAKLGVLIWQVKQFVPPSVLIPKVVNFCTL
jgi:hypothetical protein